jgi:hypothetical protein
MAIKFEVLAKTGTYTDKNGQEKNRWAKCGVVMETAKGMSLKLETMPVGSDGWFILSEPREREDQPTRKSVNKAIAEDDDVPF